MYKFLTTQEKRNLSELLKEAPCSLKLANAAQRMNLEKPFTVVKTVGKFTSNTIKKTVQASGIEAYMDAGEKWVAVVYFRPARFGRDSIHYAQISSRADRFNVEEVTAARWLPWNKTPDSFYCQRVFEDARKAHGGPVYIVAQREKYLNDAPAPSRGYLELRRLPEGERFQYIGKKCGHDYVRRIERNGEEVAVDVYGRFICKNQTIEKLTGGIFVDKSGYMALPRIEDRLQKARKLRAEREAAAARVADFSKEEAAIYAQIEGTRAALDKVLHGFKGDTETISYYRMGNLFGKFFEAVNDMRKYEELKAAQRFSSPERMKNALEMVGEMLNVVNEGAGKAVA